MEFFIIQNDEQHGPFTIDQLRDMGIEATTPVWHSGLDNWTLASDIDELRDLLVHSPLPDEAEYAIPHNDNSTPPAWNRDNFAGRFANQQMQGAPQAYAKPKKSHKGLWITLGVVALLAIILTITNPKKEDHCREITNVSRTWVNETIDNFNMNNLIGGAVKTASTWLIRSAVDEYVKVDNYVLFSIGYIDSGADKTKVSLGILGNVFTFNKDQLGEKINELISKYLQDAIDLGDFISFDSDNFSNALADGILDMIGDRVFGDRPRERNATPSNDSVSPEDNSSSLLDDNFLREGAKMIIREGADYLMDQVDDIGR